MSGYVGDLSGSQEEALRQFREAVSGIDNKPEDDDHYYLRWLRARKFDVRKAVDMFTKHIEFRKKYGMDTILQDYDPPEVMNYLPGGFFGEDREGHPVLYHIPGNYDSRGLHRSIKLDDLLKFKCYQIEQGRLVLEEQSRKHGRHIGTETIIMDCENLSIQRHYYWPAIEMLRAVLSMSEANAPEITHAVFIIRAPAIFPMAYNLIKHILDERTRKKIHVLGSNWQEELQKHISPDHLPQVYGGTRCEPDPCCSKYIKQGDDVPERFYMTNLTETDRSSMERVVVGRGSAHKVRLDVDKSSSVIQWEFISSQYDIGFGVYHKREEENGKRNKVELIATERKQSHVIPESGFYVCETSGTYILKFDNSYSWSRSKEIFYLVRLLPPSEEPGPRLKGHSPNSSHCSSQSSIFHDCNDAIQNGSDSTCGLTPPIATPTST